MPNKILLFIALAFTCFSSCKSDDDAEELAPMNEQKQRSFKMGFSTWPFASSLGAVDSTYQFIFNNGDIYSEQIDNRIPWDAWINGTPLPTSYTSEINSKVARKPAHKELLLSVSLLNTSRNDLIENLSGRVPAYNKLSDSTIEKAYFKHLSYLIQQFNPTYLIAAMEVNELLLHDTTKWKDYQTLMAKLKPQLKRDFPNLKVSESITLHTLYSETLPLSASQKELHGYINKMDFASLSFYPFFKGLHTAQEFQQAFDYVDNYIKVPVSFSETTHLAEHLIEPSLNIDIPSSEEEQKTFARILLENAQQHKYEFVIWWAHKDYDQLWQTLAPSAKPIAKVWRDTGLINENNQARPSLEVWYAYFNP